MLNTPFIQRCSVVFQGFFENVELFVSSLQALAEHSDYGSLQKELIRDRYVIKKKTIKMACQS